MGRRIHEFRLVSFQSRPPQRSLLVSVRIHHVRSLVVKALSLPWYRLHLVIDVTLSGNHASTGMLAERDVERICRLIPDRRFHPSRTFARLPSYREADRRHTMLFGTAIEFPPAKAGISLAVSSKCGRH
jgi:hypothetical protein